MVKKVKIGIVGCGLISQIMHLPHLSEMDEFEVVSLCDISSSTLKAVAKRFKVKQVFQDYDEFLKSGIESVLIAVGSSLHSEMAIKAANSGKDVFVEKDMCLSLKEAEAMIKAGDENGVIIMVGHDRRYDPGFRIGAKKIKEMSDIELVRLHWSGGPNDFFTKHHKVIRTQEDIPEKKKKYMAEKRKLHIEEALGKNPSLELVNALGMLTGVGTHQMVMIQAIFGNPEEILAAQIDQNGCPWAVIMKLPNEICCVWTAVYTSGLADYQEILTSYGKKKIISIEYPSPFLKNQPAEIEIKKQENNIFQKILLRSSFTEGFKEELHHFYDSIVTRKKPESDVGVGRDNLKTLLAIIQSYEKGKPIKLAHSNFKTKFMA